LIEANALTTTLRRQRSERGVYEISVKSMNIDDRPTDLTLWNTSNGHNSATRQPIPVMFGSLWGFRGSGNRTAPFPVGSNSRWWLAAILKTSNGHISATG